MTKRAFEKFERKPRDFYPTPEAAVLPLIPWLRRDGIRTFAEPCYGDGSLSRVLATNGFVPVASGDLAHGTDARTWGPEDFNNADAVITNPPWEHFTMAGIMEHLSTFVPCWFLTYWDWPATHRSSRLMKERCTDVVPIGRVKWIPDSPSVGFDNACWVRMSIAKTLGTPTSLWPMG